MITRTDGRRFPILFVAIAVLALAGAALGLLFSTEEAQEGSALAKPTGLSVTASHDSVTLTWDDPNDDSITGYVILRRNRESDAQGVFDDLAPDTGTAATTYTDDRIKANTSYTYRIKAINEYGVSERSRWFHIDTLAAPQETVVEGDDQDGENDAGGAPGHATPGGAGARANVSEPDGEDLPADTTTTGRVEVGGSVTGKVDRNSDRDWFAVDLESGKRYQFDLKGIGSGGGTLTDPRLRSIYDADGSSIPNTENDDVDGTTLDSRVTFTPTATGTYYVEATAPDAIGETGTYTLSVLDIGVTDDDVPTVSVSFEQGTYTVAEGSSVTVKVKLRPTRSAA